MIDRVGYKMVTVPGLTIDHHERLNKRMKGIEEETTVEKARAGDLESFQSLVEHHSRDVFRLAFRMTRNEMDAEDAVQETFLRAYKKISSFDGRSSFSTWLYRVTANTSIDIIRRRSG